MADLFAVQAKVGQLVNVSEERPLVWKWYPHREDLDMAVALHAYLGAELDSEMVSQQLAAAFPNIFSVSVQKGFLNFKFAPSVWAGFVQNWAEDIDRFSQQLLNVPNLDSEKRIWPYRWLLTVHTAHVLAHLEGWASHHIVYEPAQEELAMLKQMMAFPGILQQKGECLRKRTEIMQTIVMILQQLWKAPILTPVDLPGSAFRQGFLRLLIAVAEAVGSPLSQAPSEGIMVLP